MSNRRDKIKNSVLNINKGDTIGPVKGSIDFGPSSGYGEGSFGAPTGAQLEEQFNKKYPGLKPLTIPESFKARKDPHKTPENKRQNDVIATAGAIAMPAGRETEGAMSIIAEAAPYFKRLGGKAMAIFSKMLTKAKGNPEALVKISKSLEDIVPMAEGKGFTSRPIGEPSAAQKRKGRNDVKPAYERGYGKPGSQYPDMAKNYSNKPGEFSSLRNQNPYEKPFDPGWPHDTVYDNPNFKSKKLESLDSRAESLMNKAQRLEEVDYVEGARDLKDMANTSRESVTPAYERKAMGKPQANKSPTFEDELDDIHNSYQDRTKDLDGYGLDRDTVAKYEFDARKDIEALGKKYGRKITDGDYPWNRVFKNNEPDLGEEGVHRFTDSKGKKQIIDDYPNQKARDKGNAQDFAENNPRDKELESDNDFLKNKNSQPKIKINPTSKQIITTEDDVQLFKNKDGLVYKREPQMGELENGEPYFMGREERTPIEPRNSYGHDLLEKHFGKDAYKKQMSFLKEKQDPDWPGVTFGF